MEPVVYLIVFWIFKTGFASAGSMGVLPQASIEQCQANGAALKEFHKDYKEFRFKCVEGIR
mgnify:CR=1 FL=1|tara:strand:- start:1157 stop:1339 length:183 start_codon:yes stop_codon:yes gene_type:complete